MRPIVRRLRFRYLVPHECSAHKLLEMSRLYFIKFICTFIPSIKIDLTILFVAAPLRGYLGNYRVREVGDNV